MKKLQLGVIGCGARSVAVVNSFLHEGPDQVEVVAAYDIDRSRGDRARELWKSPRCQVVDTSDEVMADPAVNVVMIFTPNAYHCQYILAALAAGKKVFAEKPLATTLADCHRIQEAQIKSNLPVFTGFVLRYSPLYRQVKALLDTGTFGEIISVSASENRESYGGGNSMASVDGWRRFRKQSGPYLLEKCSHDLDLLNWFAGALPETVCGFGGLDYFIPQHQNLWDKFDHDVYAKFQPENKRINPFTSEKDIFDNNIMIMKYPHGIKMSFQLTLANAIPERRMYFSCTEGNIICECFSGQVTYKRYTDNCVTTLHFPGGGHGDGDRPMARELIAAMLGQGSAASGVQNGLDCARVALAIDDSMLHNGAPVSLTNWQ